MTTIIDRRLNPKDKELKNRQKFIGRAREQIKRAVKEAVDQGKIADIEQGKLRVKIKGTREPEFGIDPKSGNKKYVMPGNEHYVVGDRQMKPDDGGGRGTKGSLGEGEDDFDFVLNRDEFMDFIFEDLELPDLVKKQMTDVTQTKPTRAGYTNAGNPSQLDVIRSLKNSMGRRIGLSRPKNEEIEELERQLDEATDDETIAKIQAEIDLLRHRQTAVPWLDPVDVRYRAFVQKPQPITAAVMICVMDVSGSMGQHEKDIAKRFFFLLHMFLHRKYEKVDIVFVRHHESAKEVDEEEFFNSRESGGTVISSALKLTREIIQDRYSPNDWNIYVAQASDGDNFSTDNDVAEEEMHKLLKLSQYFAYIEIARNYASSYDSTTDIWDVYHPLSNEYPHLQMKCIRDATEIWHVFKELFSKKGSK